MFPKQITGPVTIWPTFTDKITGNQINICCVLQGCFWNDDSISVFQRTGIQTANSVALYIPYSAEVAGRQYVTPDEWNNLAIDELDKCWTASPKQMPLMVKGEYDFQFVWAAPNASNRILVQETNLQAMNPNVRRARDVNENLFGSADMWHILIRS